jgi:maleate cis-trans isomerase
MTGVDEPARLGYLYPDYAAEDDLPWLVRALFPDGEAVADVVHTTIGEDAHTVAALRETGRRSRLRAGAETLRARADDVAIWACTSGSFVFGLQGAREQAQQLAEDFGGPASSTSLAFLAALSALGIRRVTVAATYPEPLACAFLELLEEAGHAVIGASSRGIFTAAQVGRLERDAVLRLVADADHPDAEAILVPDTALHTVRLIDELERAVGKPVLTANLVTVWESLRLTPRLRGRQGAGGSLFAQPETTEHR